MKLALPGLLSLVAGLAVALAVPTGLQGSGPTGRTIVAYMGPPTLSSGSTSWLNCGWHAACGATPTAGTALDWDDENTGYNNTVYFRGWFARTNTDTPTTALDGQPVVNRADPNFCDIRDVWIIERHNGELRAVPRYLHVTFTNSSRFGIAVSTYSQYKNRAMIAHRRHGS